MKLCRLVTTLLAIFVLVASLLGQTTTVVVGDHAGTVEGEGFVRLLDAEGDPFLDAFVHDGEVVVANGALEDYFGTVTVDLTIIVDGEVAHEADGVTIHDGCGYVWHAEPLSWNPTPEGEAWLEWYFAGGAEDPDLAVCRAWDSGGPNPDPKDAGQTGSARVAWNRWGLGMALQHLRAAGEKGRPAQWAEVTRWGARVGWDRSTNYHHATEGPNGEPAGRRFRALEHPGEVLGWGYRNPGGFSDLYGRGETFFGRVDGSGRPVKAGGKWWVDRQHADNAGHVWTAAATGSWAAERFAYNMVEALVSQSMAAEWSFPNSRALGWPVRCVALLYGLTKDPELVPYIDAFDEAVLAHRGFAGPAERRVWWIVRAKPLGGHLEMSPALEAWLDGIGYQGDRVDMLRWESAWMASIAGVSFGMMADWATGTTEAVGFQEGRDRRESWTDHENVAAAFVFLSSAMPGWEVGSLEHRRPGWPWLRLSNARSPKTNIFSETRWSPGKEFNWIFGVGCGAVLPFATSFSRRHPQHAGKVMPVADALAERCYRSGWWDSSSPDRFLLDRAHHWVGVHGWRGREWRPD